MPDTPPLTHVKQEEKPVPAIQPAEQAAANAPEKNPAKEKHRTTGNKIYDWGVYTTFAWGGVALASLLSAHESQYGKNKYFNWLRSLNDNCVSGLSKFFSNTIMSGKSKDVIHGWAKGSTMFVTLGLGGWLMMAPIKWLEDNRQRNAAKIDNALGTTPPDPETIEHEPKQTWHSVLTGRLYSWGASYAAFVAMGPKFTSKLNDAIGDAAAKTWMKMRPQSHMPTVKKWADIAAFDALFTVITATATYLWSRSVAKQDEEYAATHPVANEMPVLVQPITASAPLATEKQKIFAEKHKPTARNVTMRPETFSQKIIDGKERLDAPAMAGAL